MANTPSYRKKHFKPFGFMISFHFFRFLLLCFVLCIFCRLHCQPFHWNQLTVPIIKKLNKTNENEFKHVKSISHREKRGFSPVCGFLSHGISKTLFFYNSFSLPLSWCALCVNWNLSSNLVGTLHSRQCTSCFVKDKLYFRIVFMIIAAVFKQFRKQTRNDRLTAIPQTEMSHGR